MESMRNRWMLTGWLLLLWQDIWSAVWTGPWKKMKNKEKGCSSNRNKGWEHLTSQASPSQGTRASPEAVNPETQVGQNHKSTSALAWVSSQSMAKDFKQRCDIITFFPPKNKDHSGVSVENGLKGWEIGSWKIALKAYFYNSLFPLGNKLIYLLVRFKLGRKGWVLFFFSCEKLRMKVEMLHHNGCFNWNFSRKGQF